MLRRLAIFIKFLIFSLFLMYNCNCTAKLQPLGSILFEDHGFQKKCFVQNDIAQLATRLKFQDLLPQDIRTMNDDNLMAMIKYFYGINEIIEHMSDGEARELVLKCFYDMLGSYLKHIILPISKYSFYAGNATFSIVQNIFDLYSRCKDLLDTNGNTWSDPITDFSQFNLKVLPIVVPRASDDEAMKSCSNLITIDDSNDEDMLVPLPVIETEDNDDLSTVKLPFKRKHTFSINSKKSAFVLVRYYVTVTQCFKYQGISQLLFNKRLNLWINENVLPYLDDDELYPAFGAILRVSETIKDSHDSTYSGSKDKRKRQKQQLANFIDDDVEFEFDDPDRNFNWWLNAILAVTGFLILLGLLVYMLIRICCNRKKIKEIELQKRPKRKSLKEKIANVLRNSTHVPENDEFYEYKKVRGIRFENEKQKARKSRSPTRKLKEVKLPLLSHDSEDEIVLHESKKSTPSTSLSSLTKKNLFKLSEDSESETKGRFLHKTRFKSPTQKSRQGS